MHDLVDRDRPVTARSPGERAAAELVELSRDLDVLNRAVEVLCTIHAMLEDGPSPR